MVTIRRGRSTFNSDSVSVQDMDNYKYLEEANGLTKEEADKYVEQLKEKYPDSNYIEFNY